MTKSPEEGRIWEWRAFGPVSKSLAARIRAYPVRLGLSNLRGEDIYLVSPHSDQNVKLRRYAGGWLLKFKLLLKTRPGHFELYNESVQFTFGLPVTRDRLTETAELLGVKLPESALSIQSFGEAELVKALAESSPAVVDTRVAKIRSQHQFEGGWLELADVRFATRRVKSISVHSADLEAVKGMLKRLHLGNELKPMNYIEACRRWG